MDARFAGALLMPKKGRLHLDDLLRPLKTSYGHGGRPTRRVERYGIPKGYVLVDNIEKSVLFAPERNSDRFTFCPCPVCP